MNTKTVDKKANMKPSEYISEQISSLTDWRGKRLAQLRQIILAADPEIREEWKWGTAGWSHNGMVCSAGAFKDHVRLNFFKGAALEDPDKIFNAGLDAKESRGIDFGEGNEIGAAGISEMVKRAVTYNQAAGKKR